MQCMIYFICASLQSTGGYIRWEEGYLTSDNIYALISPVAAGLIGMFGTIDINCMEEYVR